MLRANNALKDTVSGLKMRRIGSKRNLRCDAIFRGIYAFGTQVILDVAGPLDSARILIAFELRENLGIALASKVCQNIQASAVSHCNGNLVDPAVCSLIQDLVQKRDQRLPAFQRETLLAQVFCLQEFFESLGVNERRQNMALFLSGRCFKGAFNAFLDPLSLVWVLDVHVFDTDRTNVGIVQAGKQIAK